MELRNFLDKADAPVLIDQEGGRVLRLDRRISAGLSTRRGLRRPRAGLGGRAAGLAPAAVEGGFIPAFEFKTKARKLRSHGTHRRAGVADWQAHRAAGRKRTAGWRLCVNMARTACYHFATQLPDTGRERTGLGELSGSEKPNKQGLV